MNSKLFFIFILFFITSCGVKGDPKPPAGNTLPSLLENYPEIKIEESIKDQEKTK